MITHEEIIITKYETEFVAKHKDYDVIGVGSNEFEAVLELSKALGALMFSKDYKHNKVTELLDLYRLLVEFTERYNTQIRLLDKQESLDNIRELREEIYLKEKELGEMK